MPVPCYVSGEKQQGRGKERTELDEEREREREVKSAWENTTINQRAGNHKASVREQQLGKAIKS